MWHRNSLTEDIADRWVTLSAIGVLLLITLLSFSKSRNRGKLPPGPVGLPIFGYYLFLSRNPIEKMNKLAQKYGNVFSLYLGSQYTVVLSSWDAMTEALSQETSLARPSSLFESVPYNFGIVGANGLEWVHTRRLTSRAMKDIALTGTEWRDHLQGEALDLANRIAEEGGKAIEVRNFFSESFVNNVVTLSLGERLPTGNQVTKLITRAVESIIEYSPTLGMANYSPTLSKLLQVLGWDKEILLTEKVNGLVKFVCETVDEKIQKPAALVTDSLIRRFHEEIQEKRSPYITDDALKGNVITVLTGGGETTRTTVIWALIDMANHPDIQRKVHDELDSVIGKEGSLMWQDRSQIPYTYATLLESMRCNTVVPFGTLRRASGDMQIQSYHIPKGTFLTFANWSIHNDPNYWENPELFCPERFLLNEGKKVNHTPKSYNPFSYGKRNCPGKILAQMTILLYFVTIMQKFTVMPKDGKKVEHDTLLGLTYQATNVELRFIPR